VTPEPTVRRATEADLEGVHAVERAAFPQPWPYAAFERHLDAPGFLVADDGGVAGFVVATATPNHGAPLGHVRDLAVRAERRREGIGGALLRAALARLDRTGVERTKLEVRRDNEGARALYDSFEFTPTRVVPRYYDDGEDAVVMVR
jgi:ribosomal-protein-alanine N-acetyltransferase